MKAENPIQEIKELSEYVRGYSDAKDNSKLKEASKWLENLSRNICGAGYIGCHGGPDCSSDHK